MPCIISDIMVQSENRTHNEEQERIEELLQRSDTAVIYPEPVSDQEDQNIENNKEEEEKQEELSESSEEQLVCPYCDKSFPRHYVLREHIQTYHPSQSNGSNSCPKCSETFGSKSALEKHMALHSVASQSCRICHKTFANIYRLQRHMISHDESSDLRKFKCPECGKAFKFKHHLKEHVRIHSGEKPFECNNCGKRFSHSGSYSSHMTSKKCWTLGTLARRFTKDGSAMPKIEDGTGLPASYISPYHGYPMPYMPHMMPMMNSFLPYRPFAPPLLPGFQPPMFLQPEFGKPIVPQYQSEGMPKVEKEIGKMETDERCEMKKDDVEALKDEKKDVVDGVITKQTETKDFKADKFSISRLTGLDLDDKNDEKIDNDVKDDIFSCAFCSEVFSNPISHHQHERYLCSKNNLISTARTSTDEHHSETSEMQTQENAENHEHRCRFCATLFESAVEVHQHERYLCDKNASRPANDSGHMSPGIKASEASGQNSDDESEFGEDEVDADGNTTCVRSRVRSLFSEAHLRILKQHYHQNPRPRKQELLDIANQIGFTKRVVQVWFQNMRARDRRSGRHLPYSSMRNDCNDASTSPRPVIPLMPQPINGAHFPPGTGPFFLSHSIAPPAHNIYMDLVRPPTAPAPPPQDQREPLDLSCRRTPTPAHSPLMSPSALSGRIDSNALNLSMRRSPGFLADMQNPMFRGKFPTYSKSDNLFDRNGNLCNNSKGLLNYEPIRHSTPIRCHTSDEDDESCSCGDSKGDSNGFLESSFSSAASLASQASSMSELGRKRLYGLDDSAVGLDFPDDDAAYRKKRRSWKQHKVESEEGLYACDQCDKMFSKQSSLARHKYEHSGARPFVCDVCSKAFKHKHHLTEHKRLHSGEKPFKCGKCGKRFSHSGSYSQHMNHRYKYCKPLKSDEEDTNEMYDEQSRVPLLPSTVIPPPETQIIPMMNGV